MKKKEKYYIISYIALLSYPNIKKYEEAVKMEINVCNKNGQHRYCSQYLYEKSDEKKCKKL